jgi:hypothetical protein
MTKREFLRIMDKIKASLSRNNDFYCNIISRITDTSRNSQKPTSMRIEYEILFNLNNNPTFESFNTIKPNYSFVVRIAALELFEIIALKEKLYLNF